MSKGRRTATQKRKQGAEDFTGSGGDVRIIAQTRVRRLLVEIQDGTEVVRVPSKVAGPVPQGQDTHLMPEVFIQLTGYTDFTCGEKAFRLKPGEVCLMPRGMPHSEIVGPWAGKPFSNLVFMYGWPRVLFHLAKEGDYGNPVEVAPVSLDCFSMVRQVEYLEELVRVRGERSAVHAEHEKGLLLTYFADLWMTLGGREPEGCETFKVSHVRRLVARRLADPDLSVELLAKLLCCHADYLSHLFKKQTGMSLTGFINEQRILQARDMLERSAFSVKEIASAIGYRDPGYFSRVFRHLTMVTPVVYRLGHCGMRREKR
jgi:AraC-like DNA-binding protein/mannose-6-phosphate isomerase-like protein (cupin superfamily)